MINAWINRSVFKEEKEEIWLSPMKKAPTPTEKFKRQRDNITIATKNFDYTTIADRLRTVRWSNTSHSTGVVKPGYERSTYLPTNCNNRVIKRTHIKKCVNNLPYVDWGPSGNQSGEVIKMWYTKKYSNIYWNKESLATHHRYAYLLQISTLKLIQT